MVTVTDNLITMTRGDTLKCKVTVTKDGEPYTPTSGESLRFAVKRRTKTKGDYTEYVDKEPLINKAIPVDTLELKLDPADTKDLHFGKYDYDVEITLADGTVSTFIENILTLKKEVH